MNHEWEEREREWKRKRKNGKMNMENIMQTKKKDHLIII
jgi:hypothetical protein